MPVKVSKIIEQRPVAKLIPYAQNPRTHTQEQVDQIVASVKEFGWTNPILVDEKGEIIAGHGRVLAAKTLARKTVPVLVLVGLTAAQKRAYRIADNKLALNAGWNIESLRLEFDALEGWKFDTGLTGFSLGELISLKNTSEDDPDHWVGMPEFDQPDASAYRSLTVHFGDEKAVRKFAKLLQQQITDKTKYIWFPELVHETFADKVITTADES